MNLDVVISQIKAFAPLFNGNVAGAAAFAHGVEDSVWLPNPAAYVVPGDEDADGNQSLNGLDQNVTQRFEVIVCYDNAMDRRGQHVTTLYEATRLAIFGAVLNWRPDNPVDNPNAVPSIDPDVERAARGIYYGGGTMRDFDRARLFYSWTFCLDTLISDFDGWHPTGDPLTEIDADIPSDIGTAVEVVAVPLPQT